jgi:hypothetical protein
MQDLMMMGYITRFDAKSEELAFIDEYPSTQDIMWERKSRRRRKRITLKQHLSRPS